MDQESSTATEPGVAPGWTAATILCGAPGEMCPSADDGHRGVARLQRAGGRSDYRASGNHVVPSDELDLVPSTRRRRTVITAARANGKSILRRVLPRSFATDRVLSGNRSPAGALESSDSPMASSRRGHISPGPRRIISSRSPAGATPGSVAVGTFLSIQRGIRSRRLPGLPQPAGWRGAAYRSLPISCRRRVSLITCPVGQRYWYTRNGVDRLATRVPPARRWR